MFQYFRSKLSEEEKVLYDEVNLGVNSRQHSIYLKKLCSPKRLGLLVNNLLQDNPNTFYIDHFEYYELRNSYEIVPIYTLSSEDINTFNKICKSKAKRIISRYKRDSVYESVLSIQDNIARNVIYKDEGKLVHSIVGSFVLKQAVCEGYAKAFKYLLDFMGIPCILVNGSAVNPVTGSDEGHAWNMVQIDNFWFHIDVTFDTTISTEKLLRHDYFGIDTAALIRDHKFNISEYPLATSTSYNYYAKNNLIMFTKQQFRNYVDEKINNNISDFVIKLPDKTLGNDLENDILTELTNHLKGKKKNFMVQLRYNPTQKVCHISI